MKSLEFDIPELDFTSVTVLSLQQLCVYFASPVSFFFTQFFWLFDRWRLQTHAKEMKMHQSSIFLALKSPW